MASTRDGEACLGLHGSSSGAAVLGRPLSVQHTPPGFQGLLLNPGEEMCLHLADLRACCSAYSMSYNCTT